MVRIICKSPRYQPEPLWSIHTEPHVQFCFPGLTDPDLFPQDEFLVFGLDIFKHSDRMYFPCREVKVQVSYLGCIENLPIDLFPQQLSLLREIFGLSAELLCLFPAAHDRIDQCQHSNHRCYDCADGQNDIHCIRHCYLRR